MKEIHSVDASQFGMTLLSSLTRVFQVHVELTLFVGNKMELDHVRVLKNTMEILTKVVVQSVSLTLIVLPTRPAYAINVLIRVREHVAKTPFVKLSIICRIANVYQVTRETRIDSV